MHTIGSYENTIDNEVAFSRELVGKECQACRRVYRYGYFNKSAASRDGYSHICPECERAPKLSISEAVSRYREMNENSEAVQRQRREDELDYLERDPIGRGLYHYEFIHKLKQLLGDNLIVGDAYFLNEFSLYHKNPNLIDNNGVDYLGYIQAGYMNEFSEYAYNDMGVAIDETRRGYRGILMNLIVKGYITEQSCSKVFGPCDDTIWCKKLWAFRNPGSPLPQ